MKLTALWQHAARWRRLTLAGLVCAGIAATPPPVMPPESTTTPSNSATTAPATRHNEAGDTPPTGNISPIAAQPAVAQPVAAPSATAPPATPRRDPPGSHSAYALQPSRELRVDELPPEREPKPEQIPQFRGKDPRLRPSGPAELLHRDDPDAHKNR